MYLFYQLKQQHRTTACLNGTYTYAAQQQQNEEGLYMLKSFYAELSIRMFTL